MLIQHIACLQSALMRCRARCACSAYATSSEFDAFLPFWLPSAARKGGRCLRRRLGEGFSGRCPSDGYSGLLSRRFPGMRGAFFAALSVSSRQSKKMTCGITKKYSQNSIMTSKNYPMTIIDCHRIIRIVGAVEFGQFSRGTGVSSYEVLPAGGMKTTVDGTGIS